MIKLYDNTSTRTGEDWVHCAVILQCTVSAYTYNQIVNGLYN